MHRKSLAALAAAFFLAAALGGSALADSVTLGPLSLTDLWTRATPPKAPTAAGYLTITNDGDQPDRLVAAASPLAEKADLHQMQMKDGVMSMRPVEGGIEIPAKGSVTLGPDGLHIMFVSPKQPLKKGGKFPVTLTFEKAGTIETFLDVLAIGAKGPATGDGGMKMKMTQ